MGSPCYSKHREKPRDKTNLLILKLQFSLPIRHCSSSLAFLPVLSQLWQVNYDHQVAAVYIVNSFLWSRSPCSASSSQEKTYSKGRACASTGKNRKLIREPCGHPITKATKFYTCENSLTLFGLPFMHRLNFRFPKVQMPWNCRKSSSFP